MAFDQAHIAEMLYDALAGSELFVVNLTVSDSAVRPKVTVTLDGENGIGIDECALISRRLARRIDEAYGEDAMYSLEVTSPGADQPFTNPRQYARHIGRTLALQMVAGGEKTGTLEAVEEDGIQLAEVVKVKTRKTTLPAALIPFSDIQQARVVLSFK